MPHGVRSSHLPNNPDRVTPEDLREIYPDTDFDRPFAPGTNYQGPGNGFTVSPLTMGIIAFFIWRFFK